MNLLYYGDNLKVLREHIADETVDLVYLDPPFKSDQDYNVLFEEHGTKAAAQIKAFEDTWTWEECDQTRGARIVLMCGASMRLRALSSCAYHHVVGRQAAREVRPMGKERETSIKGRDAKTGQFIPVKEAKERPNTTVRERVPLPGKGRK